MIDKNNLKSEKIIVDVIGLQVIERVCNTSKLLHVHRKKQ